LQLVLWEQNSKLLDVEMSVQLTDLQPREKEKGREEEGGRERDKNKEEKRDREGRRRGVTGSLSNNMLHERMIEVSSVVSVNVASIFAQKDSF